jgi:hypothetical protein
MGRRSRKRGGPAAPTDGPAPGAPPPRAARPALRRRARLEEAPAPPWAPVPLTELCILVGLVVIVLAVLGVGPAGLLIAFGLSLVTIATAELSLREHLAGYRSHSALLAGLCAGLAGAAVALLLTPPRVVVLAVAALVFFGAFTLLRGVFARRSGGMGWRA